MIRTPDAEVNTDGAELVLRRREARAASSIRHQARVAKVPALEMSSTQGNRLGHHRNSSVILQGDNSIGEFFSVALTSGHQQADTGTKMIHIGKNTKSTIIAKGISAGHSENTYRGLGENSAGAENARNFYPVRLDADRAGQRCPSPLR